jgi:GntR family transcriptional regulator
LDEVSNDDRVQWVTRPGDDDAPLRGLDNRLLAGRARAAILKAIFDGRFESKLPSEDKLADMLNISRTTVRTALQGLERDGVVTRQRAIGTIINPHVRPSSLALQRLIGFDSLLSERGYYVEVDVSSRWGEVAPELAEIFGLAADEEYLLIEKLYRADESLALVINDAVPVTQIRRRELHDSEIDASLFTFSHRHMRSPIHHAVVKLVPQVKRRAGTRLDIAPGTPFLRLHETHYSAKGEPVACSVIDLDDGFIQLEVARTQ